MFRRVSDFGQYTNSKFLNFCLNYVRDNNVVLEVGPGDGLFANMLLEKVSCDYGFADIQDRRIFQKDKSMQIVDVSSQKLDKEDASIDIVIASQVIEHLKNMSNFIADACRVLKKDGRLILKFPNYSNLFQKMNFFIKGVPIRLQGNITNGGHINFIPYPWLVNFIGGYFRVADKKGDIFLDAFFLRRIFKKDIFLVNDAWESLHFSWNVMVCLRKVS